MDTSTLFVTLAALIMLAATAFKPGAENRDVFVSKMREHVMRGFVWGESSGRTTAR